MCGICGFVDRRPKDEKKKIIKKMNDMIVHRGPDGEGYLVDDYVALGHRRLSIIDLKGGGQPIYNEDKTKAIIFNGEIYNYQELRDELVKKGYKFNTKTDTEVILHGYEEWKDDLYNKLRGMFTFIIYDLSSHEIVGARDHFGIKPFYYYLDDDEFMFGSEIKSFLPHPSFKKEVNTDGLKMFLIFQYNVKEETFFKNVYKLKPGHYFHYKDGKLSIKKFFDLSFDRKNRPYNVVKDELKGVLEDSIKYHQITSDVEVGAYLSGGVDSSYVVSVGKPDKTFSVGFTYNKIFDETSLAEDLSNRLGLKNYKEEIEPNDFFDKLPDVQWHTDDPDANLSAVPLYFLSDLARKKVKVCLAGEGSDEMFGGYNEYNDPLALRLYLKLPLGLRRFNRNVCKKIKHHFPGKNTIIRYGRPFMERYIGHGSFMEEDEANEILADNLKSDEKISDILGPYYEKVKDQDELTKKMYIDFNFWLPQDILLKADKMSMAHSIELRTPLMDKDVFEYARTIPVKYLLKDKQTKFIFRDIASDVIPEEWSKRRKKGFPVPFGQWIKEDKYYNLVKEAFNRDYVSKFFDQKYILKLLDDHKNNRANNGRKIYNIYVFLTWYNKFFIEN